MKPDLRLLPFLVLLAVCPLQSEEVLAPEQRFTAIEQEYLSGAHKQAQKNVKAWLKADEKAPWPRLAAACLSFHEKRYKKCLNQAQDALELSPQNAEAYYWRGRCFEAKGNTLEAANEYRAALKAEAAHPRANEGLSRIQASLGDPDALPRAN